MMRPMPGSFHQLSTSHHSRSFTTEASQTSRIPRPLTSPSKRRQLDLNTSDDFSPYSTTVATSTASEYNGGLGTLSKNRKRGRQDYAGDFDDENYASSQRSAKSAQNGRSVHSRSITGTYVDDNDVEDSDAEDSTMKDSFFSDTQYRRNGGPAEQANLHDTDTRGGKRRLLDVVGVVGSVVGAVWEFCKSQAPSLPRFRAAPAPEEYFDTPYNLPPGMFDTPHRDMVDEDISTPYKSLFERPPPMHTIPFDPDNRGDSFIEDTHKFRPGHGGADSPMSASWILVAPETSTAPLSPRTAAASTASMRQQGIRPGTPIFTSAPLTQRRGYTRPVPRRLRAAGRPMMLPTSRRMPNAVTLSTPVSPSYAPGSPSSSTARIHARRETISGGGFSSSGFEFGMDGGVKCPNYSNSNSSYNSMMSSSSTAGTRKTTTMMAGKKRKDEEEEDPSIKRLNLQLKAMIREGREALGSKIEVEEYEDGDEWQD